MQNKIQKFSYSKLNTFDSCGWKYRLTYEEGHFTHTDSLAAFLGTLVHYIEEQIANAFINGETPDYEALIKDFKNINIPKKNAYDKDGDLFGIEILKQRFKDEFYATNDNGVSYYLSTLDYMSFGIRRLENYLKDNPDLRVFDSEKFFSVNYAGHTLSGYIDRIFYNTKTGEYLIEDIKTKAKLFKDEELQAPLQLVIYAHALSTAMDIPISKIRCAYDLPFCDRKQPVDNPNYIRDGFKKLDKIFKGIDGKDFKPYPSPLCHWCSFCPTNPSQPEEGKYLCPYYSLWTRENRTRAVANVWQGEEKHQEILAAEITKLKKKERSCEQEETDVFDF